MKLLVIYNDGWKVFEELEYTNLTRSPQRRAVEITLTQEQSLQLVPRETGTFEGEMRHETIESVSLSELDKI